MSAIPKSIVRQTAPYMALCMGACLAACQSGDGAQRVAAFDGIEAGETLRFAGNEPFWGGTVTGTTLRYDTMNDPDGVAIAVQRFAGNGGLGFTGTLDGRAFVMTVSPGACDDTMADRSYPYVVTVQIGDELRDGCGWTDRQPFTGDRTP